MALPAHQRQIEDDTDEELSDEQVRTLLEEAERKMRGNSAVTQTDAAPVKLPKLNPGPVADLYFDSQDPKARLDPTKLVDEKERALTKSFKKIEDPLQIKRQKLEVSIITLQ